MTTVDAKFPKSFKRLKIALPFLLLGFLFWSIQNGGFTNGYVYIASAIACVISFAVAGFFVVAAVFSFLPEVVDLFEEANPVLFRRFEKIVQGVVFILVGGYGGYMVFYALTYGETRTINRHYAWVLRSDGEVYFWASVVFHAFLAVVCAVKGWEDVERGLKN